MYQPQPKPKNPPNNSHILPWIHEPKLGNSGCQFTFFVFLKCWRISFLPPWVVFIGATLEYKRYCRLSWAEGLVCLSSSSILHRAWMPTKANANLVKTKTNLFCWRSSCCLLNFGDLSWWGNEINHMGFQDPSSIIDAETFPTILRSDSIGEFVWNLLMGFKMLMCFRVEAWSMKVDWLVDREVEGKSWIPSKSIWQSHNPQNLGFPADFYRLFTACSIFFWRLVPCVSIAVGRYVLARKISFIYKHTVVRRKKPQRFGVESSWKLTIMLDAHRDLRLSLASDNRVSIVGGWRTNANNKWEKLCCCREKPSTRDPDITSGGVWGIGFLLGIGGRNLLMKEWGVVFKGVNDSNDF